MKSYRGTFKSYSIDELSEEAKEHAYNKWRNDDYYIWGDEVKATLNEFCRIFDIKMIDWSYDSCNYNYRFRVENDTLDNNESNLHGIRLATYIWNNYAKYIAKGKYYSLWSKTEKSERNPNMGKLKNRHSKVMSEMDNCPLTGVCYDCDILEPIIDCLTYKRMFDSYEDLIEQCLKDFFSACREECEWCESMEYFIDEAQANNYEYDVDGRAFYLPREFQEVV